jgi:hypothetical protein
MRRRLISAAIAGLLCLGVVTADPVAARGTQIVTPRSNLADFARASASSDARQVADWVVGTADSRGMPFVIVDKKAAKVFVFDARGRLIGATAALLGLSRGDDSAPGIGDRKLADIRPNERTTPAGRFVASLGHGLGPKDILWVDYKTALALHRVSAASSREHRLERLAAAAPSDRRITFGCINVPPRFYDRVIDPTFAATSGVVYILPEVKTIPEVFSISAS